MSDMKVLVVYYSSSGNTQRVAQAIAQALEADVEGIQEVKPTDVDLHGKGLGNFLNMGKTAFRALSDRTVGIKGLQHSTADYDLVLVGTPVYAGSLSAPVRAFLEQARGKMKAVAFFCTGDDPANEKVFVQMQDVCGMEPQAVSPFHAPDVREGTFQPQVDTLVAQLG
jgi:flavodoxin